MKKSCLSAIAKQLLLGLCLSCATAGPASPASPIYNIIYLFRGWGDGDGANPVTGLTEFNGLFYGTTTGGGSLANNNNGTVFEVTASGAERVIHSFTGSDGARPFGNLVVVKERLYGTASAGGPTNAGTVFEVTAHGNARVVHSFRGGSDGSTPIGHLLAWNDFLYGTTNSGGRNNGTVFEVDLINGTERVLHTFGGGSEGALPRGGVIDVNGLLYGTTLQGGDRSGAGTVFELDHRLGTGRVLYRFKGPPDATNPQAGLVEMRGILYGTTQSGGANGFGAVFEIDMFGQERVLYSFKGGADGAAPVSGLRERHTQVLIEAGERFDFVLAPITRYTTTKRRKGQMLHDLREHQLADVHRYPLRVNCLQGGRC